MRFCVLKGVLVRNFRDLQLISNEENKTQFRALYADALAARNFQPLSTEDKEKLLQTASQLQDRKIDRMHSSDRFRYPDGVRLVSLFVSNSKDRKGISASLWNKKMADNLGFIFQSMSRLEDNLPQAGMRRHQHNR